MKNIYGGGSRTNFNGLRFERETSLADTLKLRGYRVLDNDVYCGDKLIGVLAGKHDLYRFLQKEFGINYKTVNSKKWLPDECFINLDNNTVYVLEKKYQEGSGSVDEKLPGCDFKRREYQKLFANTPFSVEYYYVFNDWFKQSIYKDVLGYILDTGCDYFFNEIPVEKLGLKF